MSSGKASYRDRRVYSVEKDTVMHTESGGYLIGDVLGQGIFGKVATCTKLRTGEVVAVKISRRDRQKTGRREYRMLKKLRQLDPEKNNLRNFRLFGAAVVTVFTFVIVSPAGLERSQFWCYYVSILHKTINKRWWYRGMEVQGSNVVWENQAVFLQHWLKVVIIHQPNNSSLTQVVTQPGDLDTEDVSARDEELWLPLIQSLDKLPGQGCIIEITQSDTESPAMCLLSTEIQQIKRIGGEEAILADHTGGPAVVALGIPFGLQELLQSLREYCRGR
ncbi:unnamed protein product [Menidia menidia]|uniref:(Atlantic silverside) hypothetical protein n=1 Tax=Menidia menidia TaxID=238744 RepID=A0A8S4BZ75_9TELE|nr:unnamed protein product [Menidia menidia]